VALLRLSTTRQASLLEVQSMKTMVSAVLVEVLVVLGFHPLRSWSLHVQTQPRRAEGA
jgi:hypothetical protein